MTSVNIYAAGDQQQQQPKEDERVLSTDSSLDSDDVQSSHIYYTHSQIPRGVADGDNFGFGINNDNVKLIIAQFHAKLG